MEEQVRYIFNEWIKRKFCMMPAVVSALLNHERKERCIQRTCEQIRKGELCNIGRRMNLNSVAAMVEACAAMFCENAIKHFEEQALSAAERHRRETEADRMTQIEAEFDEMNNEAASGRLVSRPGDVAR